MRLTPLRFSLTFLGLTACAPAPTPPALQPVVPVALTPSAAPTPPAPPPPPAPLATQPSAALPAPLARPLDPACAWLTRRWRPRGGPTELRVRRDGAAFATITGGGAQLQIPVGQPADAFLDVSSAGLVVSGLVDRSRVTLYATTEMLMSGVLYPGSFTPLSYAEGTAHGVSLTMETPEGIVVSKPPLRATRSCGDVALDRGARLNLSQAALGKPYGDAYLIQGDRPVALFSDPGHPHDLLVSLGEGTLVSSMATQGAYTRIAVPFGHDYLAGWVMTSRLRPTGGGGTGTSGIGFGSYGITDPVVKPLWRAACAADVALIAEADGERRTVGSILAQTPIDVIERRGEFHKVALRNRDIHPASGSVFLVRAVDLEGCRDI